MIRLEEKCVEYFFDAREYSEQEIIDNMKKELKKFEKKKAEIEITLNKYDIYVVKLIFTKKRKEHKNRMIQEKIYQPL